MPNVHRPDRISRLPKWAQDYIWQLERSLKDRNTEILDLRKSLCKGQCADIVIDYCNDSPIGLPKDSDVRFFVDLDKGKYIECRLGDKVLKVLCHGGTLRIRPHVSNSISLDVEDYWT